MMFDFAPKLNQVQAFLESENMEGWLLYDFRRSNLLAHQFLSIPSNKKVTRRFFYWIPRQGDPIKIVSQIEPYVLDHLPGTKQTFKSWEELERTLFSIWPANVKIAMEYSPCSALPTVSKVDAGIVDLIRKTGADVVSSANLLQFHTSVWSIDQYQSHLFAARVLEDTVKKTWDFIAHSLHTGFPINEYIVQQFMVKEIEAGGCLTADFPTCAVNAHSADPHYTPSEASAEPIKKDDFILLDLWCKQNVESAVYADITRMGVAAKKGSDKQQHIFDIVKSARDHATQFVKGRYETGKLVEGWEVDEACRQIIKKEGYADFFIHRTGHNLGEEVHGAGANLDNLESHDYRHLLPGTAFTIEPGIYLPQEFGVRLEYDIYLNPSGKMEITGGIQNELVCLE